VSKGKSEHCLLTECSHLSRFVSVTNNDLSNEGNICFTKFTKAVDYASFDRES